MARAKCQVNVREVVESLREQDSVSCLAIATATRRDFVMVERPKNAAASHWRTH